ncbi:MAG: hypothetical protein HFJ40_07825 [Clostridia bacterium]|nr:hypothetical protein [Clostridia bacterium]
MKVLFAVSNEEISESIVKKYQKEYKQIISYKNVYYFNAILKEIQKDKTYDRIVISEDLEAFTNNQYDQIDKFIFDKLDSISDEASNTRGNDIPIILICSDRRNKSEQILVKLFGIGVYNAIIGNDRSVDEVCRLINRPRVKKEAKVYYKIDSENVNYQAENENDVSEMEIQNIVAHYKRLGKDENRYIDSFNNIAAQYNDTQLRIISKFLPLNVRAVLEEKSTKYQQIMSFNNTVSDTLRKTDKKQDMGPSEKLLKSQNRGQIMSKPVVIPSSVNMNGSKKLSRTKPTIEESIIQTKPSTYELQKEETEPIKEEIEEVSNQEIEQKINLEPAPEPQPVKRGRGRPRKNPIPDTNESAVKPVKRGRGRPRKNPIPEEPVILPGFDDYEEDETILPGVGQSIVEPEPAILPGFEEVSEQPAVLPGFEDYEEDETVLPGVGQDIVEPEPAVLPGFETIDNQPEQEPEDNNYNNYNGYNNNEVNNYGVSNYEANPIIEKNNYYESTIDLSNLLTPDKKIVTFVGTSKNGTSFIVNNIAELMSSLGINTVILDTTKNRNSYYIYTKNEEQLRNIASNSIQGLVQGTTQGITVNKNLTVYTSLPDENESIQNVDEILQTLVKNYSLILIDTDFDTPIGYFKQSQETYLVQSLDVLTIQPLTAFLRELKAKNVLDERKLRIILNKTVKIRGITEKVIIGGMAYYNDPAMSFMTELFDRNTIKYVSIPFEEEIYTKYLENIIECNVSLKGYSKMFMQTLKELGNMIYPLGTTKNTYNPPSVGQGRGNFSANMNNTLNQMKRNY